MKDMENKTWEMLCENMHLMESITGRTLHHGESDYDTEPFFIVLEDDASLVNRVLAIYGIQSSENHEKDLSLAVDLTEEAFFTLTE